MYESFFQLRHRPFAAAPSPQRYIAVGPIEQARQTLVRCIERAEGPGLIVGPSGIGKSLLCHLLAQQFRGRFQLAQLSGGRLGTRRALLQNILFELQLPYRDMDEAELRLSLIDHLNRHDGSGEGLLLIVDEAHLLPVRLLDEIRLLTNLVHQGQPQVSLVLAGGPAIEERLASPKLESLQQRIAARCYLQPLNRDETISYIRQQLESCGGDCDQLFAHDAVQAVYSASDGIPRLVNQLADHALVLAALAGVRQITLSVVQEAWSDLQQLPAPWHDSPKLATTLPAADAGESDFIEFGALDEPAEERVQPTQAAEQQLERLGRGVAALHDEFDAAASYEPTLGFSQPGDFHPLQESNTEVELVFPPSQDPFGGNWEEEEVVIDRYASLESQAVSHRPRVKSDEGREIGSALAAIDNSKRVLRTSPRKAEAIMQAPAVLPLVDESENEGWNTAEAIQEFNSLLASYDLDPASDPVMPETTLEPQPSAKPAPVSLRDFADDRDIIVIEEGAATPLRALAPRESKRQDYRRLFSSLRNR